MYEVIKKQMNRFKFKVIFWLIDLYCKKNNLDGNSVEANELKLRFLDSKLFEDYIPEHGLNITLQSGFDNADELFLTLDSLTVSFIEGGYVSDKVVGIIGKRRDHRLDDILVYEDGCAVGIDAFVDTFKLKYVLLLRVKEQAYTNKTKGGYYQRKTTEYFNDLGSIMEALVKLALAPR